MSRGNPYNKGYNIIGKYNPTYINEDGNKRNTPQYSTWVNMLGRCYNPKFKENKPTYMDCTVTPEWLNFQNFGEWYDKNYYTIEKEQISLDKDIITHGNKIYSPENCIFVPAKINSIFTGCKSVRGEMPIGITCKNNKYRARVSDHICSGKRIDLGCYDTLEDAFKVYKIAKENIIKQVAEQYKSKIPQKLYDAMYAYQVEITD